VKQTVERRGLATAMSDNAKPQPLAGILAEWWRSLRREGVALARVEKYGSKTEHSAHDREFFRVLAAKRPDTVDLILQRLGALHPDPCKSPNDRVRGRP
jgi:hypothetical protein